MRSYILPFVGGLLLVAGCAGRDARPVDAFTPYDEQMSCNAISQEIASNNGKIHATVAELQETKGQNVAVGVAGALLFLPILFALDVSDAEKTEIAALENRNENLAKMGHEKECEVPERTNFQEALQEYKMKDEEERKKAADE